MLTSLLPFVLLVAPVDESPRQSVGDAMHVEPGASCLNAERLVSKIVTGGITDVDARLDVEVVGDAEDPWLVEYVVRRRGEVLGTRRFDGETTDCEQLHASIAAAIAVAVDLNVVLAPEPVASLAPRLQAPREPEQPVEEPGAAPRLDARQGSSPSQERGPWTLRAVIRGGIGLDAPPRVGGVGAVAIEAGWKEYLDLSLGFVGARAGSLDAGSGQAVFSLLGARVDLCGGYRVGIVRPRVCAGMLGGGAIATGRSFSEDQTSILPWVAGTAGIDVRVRVAKRVELELGADGLAHILRPAFDFVDEGGRRRVGYEFPGFGGWVMAGFVVRLR